MKFVGYSLFRAFCFSLQYFKLKAHQLVYWEKKDDKDEKDTFDLRETLTITDGDAKAKDQQFDFILTLKGKTLHLRAANAVEKKQWLRVLSPFNGMGSKQAPACIPVPATFKPAIEMCLEYIAKNGLALHCGMCSLL